MKRVATLCLIVLTALLVVIAPGCSKAIFELSNLTITPQEVEPGQSVTISVDVSNTGGPEAIFFGGAEGTYHLILKINGVQVDDQNVTVAPEATETVSFTVAKEEPGSYSIDVNGLTTTLVVLKPAQFKMEALIVSPTEVLVGWSATVTVDVTNIGEVEGDCEVTLRVDDRDVETKRVTIAAGATKRVTFTLLEEEEGTYNLSVDVLSGTLTVVTPPTPPRPAIESLTYTNLEYGFSLEYPKDWDFEEGFTGLIVIFAGPLIEEEEFIINMNIASEELPKFPKMTLEDYVKASKLAIKKMIENYKEVGEHSTTIGGQAAIVLTYTGSYEKATLQWTQACFLKENVAYVVTYIAPPDFHGEYVDCFDLVIMSFKFE